MIIARCRCVTMGSQNAARPRSSRQQAGVALFSPTCTIGQNGTLSQSGYGRCVIRVAPCMPCFASFAQRAFPVAPLWG